MTTTAAAQAYAQFDRFKALSPQTLLMIRVGDFYEMYHDDAEQANKVLGVTLTQREGVPMVGMPYHSVEGYLRRLIVSGCRVAVCEAAPQNN